MISLEKLKIFDTFTKIAWKCGRFGQAICCHRLWKVTQSPKIAQSGHTVEETPKGSILSVCEDIF